MAEWQPLLRHWRQQTGMSRPALAARSGVSVAAIRAYEAGARHPSSHALRSLIDAIGMPADDANKVLAGAGYAIEWEAPFQGRIATVSAVDLAAGVASCPWPAFITNQSFDVVATNDAMAQIFDVDADRDLTRFGERNFIGGITHDEFADRLENWDEVVEFMCGLIKSDPRWNGTDVTNPAPWIRPQLERLLSGNPRRVQRLLETWERALPIPHRIQQQFRVCWLYGGEERLVFSGRLVMADLWSELHWNEWIPGDTATWLALDRLRASRDQTGN